MPGITNKELEKDMKEFIFEICEKIGPRPPCSVKEAEAAGLYYEYMKSCCDTVDIEKFYTHPAAFKAGFRVPMILYIVSLIFYWYLPWFSLIISIFSIIILFGKMTLAKEVFDFIFPKKESQNVISKIKPTNQTKNLIIIGSHIDSNWEFSLIRKIKNKYTVIIGINVFLNVFLLILLIAKNILILLGLPQLFFIIEVILFITFVGLIPLPLMQLFFVISNRPVMGANDNLSGMAVCYELAKNLTLPENRPQNTEVWINAYGCEEIGSKGSKAFVKRYFPEIRNAKIINIDGVGCKNVPILIGKSEIQGMVKMNSEMIELIKKSADNLDIKNRISSFMFFTDSLSFCRNNLSASSICTWPSSKEAYFYHTRDDVIENMGFENLINTYKICMEIIKDLDK